MKLPFQIILPIFLLLCAPSLGQAQDNDTTSVGSYEVLDINGKITHGEDALDGVLVELFEGNRVVDAFETKKNGKFKFTLLNNQIYTIQLTKDGYYTKRISVNTNMPSDYEDTYRFEFDINLDSREDQEFDKYLVEYPSALIAFEKKKDRFNFDKDYTKSYFDEIQSK